MLGQQGVQVHIADPVAVGQHKGFISNILLHALDPPAGLGVQARVHQRHPPGLRNILMDGHVVLGGEIKGHIGPVEVVVCKILLDEMALVAAADDEVMEAKAGVIFHNVPQDGLFANSDHGLGFQMALLADAGAQAAGQDRNLHLLSPSSKYATR